MFIDQNGKVNGEYGVASNLINSFYHETRHRYDRSTWGRRSKCRAASDHSSFMEQGNTPKTCVLILIAILSYIFVSCGSESYLDLLTGGSIRYWQYKEHKDSYVSFDKRTQRRLLYDANLKIFYINLSKGQYFKIEANRNTTK